MATISRRKLADHASQRLLRGDSYGDVVKELAAYLVDTRRTKELTLIVRDIELSLARHGTVIARITSARELSADALQAITDYVKRVQPDTNNVVVQSSIDESIIGGVKIELPGSQLDASIKTTLDRLTYQ